MSRPKRADAEATRQRILDSALASFSEHGFDGVSIRKIGAGAGVTLATVHHYFGSKDDLYEACIDTMYAQMEALQPQLTSAIQTALANGDATELVRRVFRFGRSHQIAMRLLLRQVMAAGELDDARRERVQAPFLDRTSRIVAMLTGRHASDVRLSIQTIQFTIVRYAISTERELELFTGQVGDAAIAAVEDHLVRTANALFPRG